MSETDILTLPPDAPAEPLYISMDTIREKPIEWLVPGYIPKGAITTLAADGGSGKTLLMCDLLAAISTGRPSIFEASELSNPQEREPGNVLFFSGEDSLSRVLKKRLRQADADLQRVFTVGEGENVTFGSKLLERLILELSPALVAFDPLQAFIPSNVDLSRRNQMREQFGHLVRLAEKYGTTFLILCHTNKRDKADGRNRAADSSDLWDVSRSFLMAGQVNGEIHFSQEKSNYGPLQETIICRAVGGRLRFIETSEKRDADFQAEKSERKAKRNHVNDAAIEEFIYSYLHGSHGREVTGAELRAACIEQGFSGRTTERIRSGMNSKGYIKMIRTGKGEGQQGAYTFWTIGDVEPPWIDHVK